MKHRGTRLSFRPACHLVSDHGVELFGLRQQRPRHLRRHRCRRGGQRRSLFPDEEALQAQADAFERARATYIAGLRRHQNGDPVGLEWICLSAHQGYARAQYFYGTYLYQQGPEHEAESVGWLWRAAAQGHPEADMMLRQVAGVTAPVEASANHAQIAVVPPSIRACASNEIADRHATLEEGPF
jgi:hypothetical protein